MIKKEGSRARLLRIKSQPFLFLGEWTGAHASVSLSGKMKPRAAAISQDCSVSSAQSLNHVRLFAILWTAAHQASLSIANSQGLLRLMSIESVMPSNHPILYHPLLLFSQSFPASRSFLVSQLFTSGDQSIGASASASVVPLNIETDFLQDGLV